MFIFCSNLFVVRGITELSEEELQHLSRGGRMWEKNATKKKNKLGTLGDVFNLFEALAGALNFPSHETSLFPMFVVCTVVSSATLTTLF